MSSKTTRKTASNVAQRNCLARELVDDFLADCCEFSDGHRIGATKLYQVFADWCRNNGVMKVITKKRFGLILGNSFDRIKSGAIFYIGLRLKQKEVVHDV